MGNLDFDKLRDRNVVDTMLRSINESISFADEALSNETARQAMAVFDKIYFFVPD